MFGQDDPDSEPSWLDDISTMVVDDDSMMTSLIDITLRAIGLENIYTINDPRQALDFLAEGINGIQLVVCDMDMPEVSGIDVLERVRKDIPRIPFLMLTANRSSDAVTKAAELGVSGYMVKPFQQADLQEKVKLLLTRRYGKQILSNRPASPD